MWIWTYLLENSVWSLGGLFVGYHLGRTEREVQALNRKVEENLDDDHA